MDSEGTSRFRVTLDGKFFRLGQKKFFVKGVTYGPFVPGHDGEPFGTPEETARDFAFYIADAEERGRIGAERFSEVLKTRDPETAKMFYQIALEEREHIALVEKFFNDTKN